MDCLVVKCDSEVRSRGRVTVTHCVPSPNAINPDIIPVALPSTTKLHSCCMVAMPLEHSKLQLLQFDRHTVTVISAARQKIVRVTSYYHNLTEDTVTLIITT
jgi:hypothetical protein